MMAKLAVSLGQLQLKNPVMAASGTFGYGREMAELFDVSTIGAIVGKSVTVHPRAGNPPQRIVETPAGMLNSIGLENIGIDAFLEEELPFLNSLDTVIIANIAGETFEEYGMLANKLGKAEGVDAVEVNVSCPNVDKGGMLFGISPDSCYEITKIVKASCRCPVIMKLTPNVTSITEIADACEEAGADVLSLTNTFLGMSVDVDRRAAKLPRVVGGLSGPAIRPLSLRMVWDVVSAVDIPVIGIGGILNFRDALEFLIAGARAVQVGCGNFINPRCVPEIIAGIETYLTNNNIDDVNKIIGSLRM